MILPSRPEPHHSKSASVSIRGGVMGDWVMVDDYEKELAIRWVI